MSTQFLVRPRPFEGESLSSWRQRTALLNGFRLYPTEAGELRRADPDFGHTPDVIASIAHKSRLTAEDLTPLCLSSLEGKLFLAASMREHPHWIIRTRYSRGILVPGPSYCPFCMGVESPYFRLEWRVAFVTTCTRHGCELLDACPKCGAGIWPVGTSYEKRFAGRYMPLGGCLECGASLGVLGSDISIPAATCAEDQHWAARLLLGAPQYLNDALRISSAEYLIGLDALCHLFIRRRALERLAKAPAPWGDLAKNCLKEVPVNQVEYLRIATRRSLISALRPVLLHWPLRFIEFASITGITQEHFSGAESLMPAWMAEVVNKSLRRQRRGIDLARVQAEADVLRLEGRKITKAELRARLGNAGAINAIVTYRQAATDQEKQQLLDALDHGLEGVATYRVPYAALLRNQYFILLAILERKTLSQAVDAARTGSGSCGITGNASTEDVLELKSWLPYEAITRRAVSLNLVGMKMENGDRTDFSRAAQRALHDVMKSMDPTLLRRISVFW